MTATDILDCEKPMSTLNQLTMQSWPSLMRECISSNRLHL